MSSVAYKPPQSSSKNYDISEVPKGKFPFSHVYASTGAGIESETYEISTNVVITGLFYCILTDSSAANAAITAYLNGIQICAATVVGAVGAPACNSCYIAISEWNTSSASRLKTNLNCTAGHGQANVTWLGYYK